MESGGWWFLGALETLSLFCAVRLWRRQDRVWRKLAWTSVLALPLLGPLLYGGLYEMPSIQPDHEQAPTNSNAEMGAFHP
jgi:hypothetical protein